MQATKKVLLVIAAGLLFVAPLSRLFEHGFARTLFIVIGMGAITFVIDHFIKMRGPRP